LGLVRKNQRFYFEAKSLSPTLWCEVDQPLENHFKIDPIVKSHVGVSTHVWDGLTRLPFGTVHWEGRLEQSIMNLAKRFVPETEGDCY
jgi:hypothetical protein